MKLKAQDFLIINNGIVFNGKDRLPKVIFMNFLKSKLRFMDIVNFSMLVKLRN